MISAVNIKKKFGNFYAINGLSFEIGKGEIVGFLGKNGAGKTTLMRILTSYLSMTSGKLKIFDKDISRKSLHIRRGIGYLPENLPLYHNMSVERYLRFAAQLKDIPPKQHKPQVERVLAVCKLAHVSKKQISTLSKGYKQRVGIAQAIINEPELLILDEPTNGLDPIQIIQVREIIKGIECTRTVLLSTHILTEIEQLANRVLIIKSGEKLVDENLPVLLSPKDKRKNVILEVAGQKHFIEDAIKNTNGIKISDIVLKNSRYVVQLDVSTEVKDFNELTQSLIKEQVNILGLMEIKPSLEEIFLKLHS